MPDIGGIAGERLRSFIERIERLEEEKRALSGDIKEVFAEAKGNGFDTKIMRQLIRIRRMDKDDLDEQETLLDLPAWVRDQGALPRRPTSEGHDAGSVVLARGISAREIAVFADNLFEHGDHEVAVLMGQRRFGAARNVTLIYRRVRERGGPGAADGSGRRSHASR